MKIYMVRYHDLKGVSKYHSLNEKSMKAALAKFENNIKYKEIFEIRLMTNTINQKTIKLKSKK